MKGANDYILFYPILANVVNIQKLDVNTVFERLKKPKLFLISMQPFSRQKRQTKYIYFNTGGKMSLREILEGIIQNNDPILLCAGENEYEADDLLHSLHPVKLKRRAHMQNGLYIAAISDAGYLGDVMYKIKNKA